MVTRIQSQDNSEIDLAFCQNVYLRVDVCNTGFSQITKDDSVKKIYEAHRQLCCSVASFAIKINNRTLIGDLVSNQKKSEIAMKIKSLIIKGYEKAKNNKDSSFSNLPCFDIHFHNIIRGPVDYKALYLANLANSNQKIPSPNEQTPLDPISQTEGYE